MAQAHSHLSASHPSVERVAGAINVMIAERAEERLRKPPAAEAPARTPSAGAPRAPGVYFGLSSADYHADPSLGSSDIKRLPRSPSDYWWESHLNPERPPNKDTPARQKGRALHTLVLEGDEPFAQAFRRGAAAQRPSRLPRHAGGHEGPLPWRSPHGNRRQQPMGEWTARRCRTELRP